MCRVLQASLVLILLAAIGCARPLPAPRSTEEVLHEALVQSFHLRSLELQGDTESGYKGPAVDHAGNQLTVKVWRAPDGAFEAEAQGDRVNLHTRITLPR